MNNAWMDCCRTRCRFFHEVQDDMLHHRFVILNGSLQLCVQLTCWPLISSKTKIQIGELSAEMWEIQWHCVHTVGETGAFGGYKVTMQPLDSIKIHWLILLLCWQPLINLHFLLLQGHWNCTLVFSLNPDLWHRVIFLNWFSRWVLFQYITFLLIYIYVYLHTVSSPLKVIHNTLTGPKAKWRDILLSLSFTLFLPLCFSIWTVILFIYTTSCLESPASQSQLYN